jgi:hypothetical protein
MYRPRPLTNISNFHKLAFIQANAMGNVASMKSLYSNASRTIPRGKTCTSIFDMLLIAFGDITKHTTVSSLAWIHEQMKSHLKDTSNNIWLKQRRDGAFRSAIHQNRLDLVIFIWNLTLSGAFLSGLDSTQEAADLLMQHDYRCFTDACASGNLEIVEFIYDTSFIHKCIIPASRMEACWISACIDGRLDIAKWLYHKCASIGIILKLPETHSPVVDNWLLHKKVENEWVLVDIPPTHSVTIV